MKTSKTGRQRIISLLEEYPEIKQKMALLEYELENTAVSENELIEAMALRPSDMTEVTSGSNSVSDPTARIAMEYKDVLSGLDEEAKASAEHELKTLRNIVDRLNFYIKCLPQSQEAVIRGYYIEGKTWAELEKELDVSTRTLLDHRDKGVDALVRMFQYISSRGKKKE